MGRGPAGTGLRASRWRTAVTSRVTGARDARVLPAIFHALEREFAATGVCVVRGVLSLGGVRVSGSRNDSDAIAEGSAAGGVLLTLTGSGFDIDAHLGTYTGDDPATAAVRLGNVSL